jgi:glycosyltransferase involved in cell wall biosynthesis
MLRDAVESVLRQGHDPVETLVVDDSGEKHAEPVIEEYDQVTYIAMEENSGPNPARNRAINAAVGDYIQILDDDDEIINGKFEKQIALFKQNPDVGVVYGGVRTATGEEYLPKPEGRGDVLKLALMDEIAYCWGQTMLFDRAEMERILPLRETPGADDTHWKIQMAQHTKFDFVDEAVIQIEERETSRKNSFGAIRGMDLMFEWYDDLYEQFPPEVLKRVKTRRHNRMGDYLLDQRPWSPTAIWAYLLAFYHTPTLGRLGICLISIFGRPGTEFIRRL